MMKKFTAHVKGHKVFEFEDASPKEALLKAKKLNPKVTHINGPAKKKHKG